VKFAEVAQKPITPVLANIWAEQLSDIEPDLLARACDRLMKKWNVGFLPVPGNIRAEAESLRSLAQMERDAEQRRLRAEQEHRRAIAYAEHKRQLPPPFMSEAEKEEALKCSAEVRERLQIVPRPPVPPRKPIVISPVQPKSFAEQMEILRRKNFL
jgi:hypothetical protein